MTEERGPSVPTAREACKHLRLPVIDDAIENLHMLTVLSTLGPHHLDAGRCIVTSRFRCRSFDRRYVVGALSTGRCLPAVAPRVLIMGDGVRSRSLLPDYHFHRFQVTAPSPTHDRPAHPAPSRRLRDAFPRRSNGGCAKSLCDPVCPHPTQSLQSALTVAQQQRPEVDTLGQRRPAMLSRIELRTSSLHKLI